MYESLKFAGSMEITQILIAWYGENKRDLPWREVRDPYKIWLSEIILQQTRVDQGMEYYHRFVDRFATIHDLANASEEDVLKLWQGLGYYSRARNLHHTAKIIANDLDGVFPDTYNGLLDLKGIGPYTAAAIASISFDQPHPVVDGNVSRVISRLFAINEPVNESVGKKKIDKVLKSLMDKSRPGIFNQALMEFGALFCKPKNPSCHSCPLSSKCMGFENGLVNRLPVKSKKVKVKQRFFNYFIIRFRKDDRYFVYLNKRGEKDIWQGLYDFPLIETNRSVAIDDLVKTENWKVLFGDSEPTLISVSDNYKHQLTHRQIIATFYVVEIMHELNQKGRDFILVYEYDIHNYPLPRLIDRYLAEESA
jgi:A/G-specific adenine glycosylase